MFNKYSHKGLLVLGFPCGQFMGQELNKEEDIKNYIETKFKVEFPMFSKIQVNGERTHPIYKYLKYNSKDMHIEGKGLKNIPWNFAKFLVNSEGKVIKFYPPNIEPKDMLVDVETLLF